MCDSCVVYFRTQSRQNLYRFYGRAQVLGPVRRLRFTKATQRHADIRENKGPSLGKIQVKPQQRTIWQPAPRSRRTNWDERSLLSKEAAYVVRHQRDCHEAGGACLWYTSNSSNRECRAKKGTRDAETLSAPGDTLWNTRKKH